MPIINLMEHACIIKVGEKTYKIPPSGTVAKVEKIKSTWTGDIWIQPGRAMRDGFHVPIILREAGDIIDLPEPCHETIYLVSPEVVDGVPNRSDIFTPDIGETAIRNEKGQVTAVTQLIGNA